MFFLATRPPQLLCSAVEPPNNTARQKGWNPHCFGADATWIGNPECMPHCHSVPEQSGSPTIGMAAPGAASGLASSSPLLAYMVGTFTLAACAGKWALVVTPRKSKPIPVGYGETTCCLKKALSCISVFLVFVKDTYSHPHEPWEISMFSFTPWQYSWAIWLSSFSPPSLFSPPPHLSKHLCRCGPAPPVVTGQNHLF